MEPDKLKQISKIFQLSICARSILPKWFFSEIAIVEKEQIIKKIKSAVIKNVP